MYKFCLGLRFFRLRLSHLIREMFEFQPIHYASNMLHPKYRHLRRTDSYDKSVCKSFILQMMRNVNRDDSYWSSSFSFSNGDFDEPPTKKRKDFGEDFETGNVSDEYDDDYDELEKYLCKRLDVSNLPENPLHFWKDHGLEFPILAKVACQIFSIPASTASVERAFSASGNIVNKRRSNIKPCQLDNIIFLRSMYFNSV